MKSKILYLILTACIMAVFLPAMAVSATDSDDILVLDSDLLSYSSSSTVTMQIANEA